MKQNTKTAVMNKTKPETTKTKTPKASPSSVEDEEELRLQRNAEIVRSMPDNIASALAKAREKPIWCSDIRWRMELARRKKYLNYLI